MRETDFDALYREDPDPFEVGSSWYERRKQSAVLAALAQEHYEQAWDCAAGTGHLATALAARCDAVLATDSSPRAVELAADLSASLPNVVCQVGVLPAVPSETADLVVVGEVLYYLAAPDREALVAALADRPAELVLVHWRHLPHDAWLSGADVHAETAERLAGSGREQLVHHVDRDFVLDAWGPA